MSNIHIIRIPLSSDEVSALQRVAKDECRLDYEQIRFALRLYLCNAGALPGRKCSMKQIAIALLGALAVVIGLNVIALIVGIAEMYSHRKDQS